MAEDTKSIKIGIYRLDRIEDSVPGEWASLVIAAKDEKAAREIANQESRGESYIWAMPEKAKAVFVGAAEDGVEGLIVGSEEPSFDEPWDVAAEECGVFLLERAEIAGADEWAKAVVVGRDEKVSRRIANLEAAHAAGKGEPSSESAEAKAGYVWTDGRLTHARRIGTARLAEEGVVLGTKDAE